MHFLTLGSELAPAFLNRGAGYSLPFLLDTVQCLSSIEVCQPLLLISVWLSEHLSTYKPQLLIVILNQLFQMKGRTSFSFKHNLLQTLRTQEINT